MIRYSLLLSLFICSIGRGECQDRFVVNKDLQSDWLVYETESYRPFSESEKPVTTIYLSLNPKKYKGDHLVIVSSHAFSVMLNGKLLLDNCRNVTLSMDSLENLYPTPLHSIAIHQQKKINFSNLTTYIRSNPITTKQQNETPPLKKDTSFRDFVITIMLILFIFLIAIIRVNPRLSSDYFSITKIFSPRDNEEDQFYYRLTSGNILFYVFTSLVLAFYLIVIGQYVEINVKVLKTEGYLNSLLTWLQVSGTVIALLFTKMLVVYIIASLFGVRDIAGFHFFNFIRLLLAFMGILTLVLATYYILHGQQKGFYSFLYELLNWILGGWVMLLFIKLANRVQYSVFHLFSYICATEIIPFLLIFKVLNE